MPTERSCPKCGTKCYFKAIISGIVYGYKCDNCDTYFGVLKNNARIERMKLDIEELKRLEIEMEENEQMREMMWAYNMEHEDAGDRI